MTTPLDIAYRDMDLEPGARRHLERLTATWNLLADLCFSDLLLYVPTDSLGLTETGRADTRFVVMGQVRPTTNPTLFEIDLVGQVVSAKEVELVLESLRTGAISIGEQRSDSGEGHLRLECIPVRYSGQVIAVMCRQWSPSTARRRGSLERVYLDLFERLSVMVTDGIFPFADDDLPVETAPRVGDGVIVVDDRGRISYASPNAVSALHRIGIVSAMNGATLPALGLDTKVVQDAFATRLPVVEEIERRSDTTLLVRCIPLVATGEVTGGAVLVRDVTDVRRRDRLLLTKDATIREVHHRVKNNLQTISSLLRLQGRRIDNEAGRTALAEAERRIRAIAVVHEILSRESGDQVPFDEIVHALVRMAHESSDAAHAVAVRVDGHLGDIPADMATPLSVVLAELLQNAVEHAFQAGELDAPASAAPPRIELVFKHDATSLDVTVHDNGAGLPAGFDIESTRSLGLSIVRDLVRTQLGGTITMTSRAGTLVGLSIPMTGQPGWTV
ncbi:MAG TPA: sensor histidine kinase [Acidimicrobiales bacterium]|nr:sensor histidine kinase [Acidimicrobiales bacterium]